MLFPPLAIYEAYLATAFVSSVLGGVTTRIATLGAMAYYELMKQDTRILGPPLFSEPGI
jgi:hypothetical protein